MSSKFFLSNYELGMANGMSAMGATPKVIAKKLKIYVFSVYCLNKNKF